MNREKKPTNAGPKGAPARTARKVGAREAALDVLTRVERDQAYSNLLLHQTLEKHRLERQDAALATELVYGTIGRLNTVDYFLEGFVAKGLARLEPWVRSLLRLSFYQLYYLDRIPPHAAVNEAVELAKRRGHQGISGMVNGVLRNVLRRKNELQLPSNLPAVKRIALEYSHPEWMVERWLHRYGEADTIAICAANNEPPRSSVRVNRLRIEREQMLDQLRSSGYEAELSALAPAGITVTGGGNLASTPWYQSGELSIQDESSMLVAEVLAPEPGMRVLDCCAAPGGKSAHLAELMHDKGSVCASDVHEHKEKLICDQAQRLRLTCIRTLVSDARNLSEHYPAESFDRILLDAPCSGLGVIRRKPDLKWAKQAGEIAEIARVQQAILANVHLLLKPGGVFVYSTCTLEPEENEEQIRNFLHHHPNFELAPFPDRILPEGWIKKEGAGGMLQLLPHHFHSDGFFIARLVKRN